MSPSCHHSQQPEALPRFQPVTIPNTLKPVPFASRLSPGSAQRCASVSKFGLPIAVAGHCAACRRRKPVVSAGERRPQQPIQAAVMSWLLTSLQCMHATSASSAAVTYRAGFWLASRPHTLSCACFFPAVRHAHTHPCACSFPAVGHAHTHPLVPAHSLQWVMPTHTLLRLLVPCCGSRPHTPSCACSFPAVGHAHTHPLVPARSLQWVMSSTRDPGSKATTD
eukprot:364469-Chlamydomonas_euryale.AAC.7